MHTTEFLHLEADSPTPPHPPDLAFRKVDVSQLACPFTAMRLPHQVSKQTKALLLIEIPDKQDARDSLWRKLMYICISKRLRKVLVKNIV